MKLGFLKIANSTPTVKPGNIEFNINEIKKTLENVDADIITFPEMAITGYSCGDLFLTKGFIDKAKDMLLCFVKENTFKGIIILGCPIWNNHKLYNTAVVIKENNILGIVPKSFLPNKCEFQEKRWFNTDYDFDNVCLNGLNVPFGKLLFSDLANGVTFGVEICYDMFAPVSPADIYAVNGANVIFNIAASTEAYGKDTSREAVIVAKSRIDSCCYSYTSCGINESTAAVVYGGARLVAMNGGIINKADMFLNETDIMYTLIDIDKLNKSRIENNGMQDSGFIKDAYPVKNISITLPDTEYLPELDQLPFIPKKNEMAAFEYMRDMTTAALYKRLKAIGCKSLVIGVSGGLDSTHALLVAVRAFKKLGLDTKGILAVTLPGLGTTDRTKNNAWDLMQKLGVSYKEINISDSVMSHFKDIEHDPENTNVTYENAQARMRTMILMDLANDLGGIVLGTGDMSEVALGWCTYNGDQMAMYGVNAGIPKTLLRFLVKNYAEGEFNIVKDTLLDIIDTPISPELKKGQKTEDTVGKYEINDFILYNYLVNGYNEEKIAILLEKAFNVDPKFYIDNFFRRFRTQSFKRNASPDAPRILGIALDGKTGFILPSDL